MEELLQSDSCCRYRTYVLLLTSNLVPRTHPTWMEFKLTFSVWITGKCKCGQRTFSCEQGYGVRVCGSDGSGIVIWFLVLIVLSALWLYTDSFFKCFEQDLRFVFRLLTAITELTVIHYRAKESRWLSPSSVPRRSGKTPANGESVKSAGMDLR